jgi:methionyl-tRNA formyltransferase
LRIFPFLTAVADTSGSAPGTVLALDGDAVVVRTGDGAVRFCDVQPAGSRRMSAREAAAGRRIAVGDRLGVATDGRSPEGG